MTDDRKDEDRRTTPSWHLPQERQPDTSAYHIWTPRPLLRSIYWKPVPPPSFEIVSASYEVFLEQRAWLTMHEHVWQAPPDRTPFGYLVGDLCEDPTANRRFVIVTSALPARFVFREGSAEQISREALLALQLEVERLRGVLVGWYHRHIGGDVVLTESDVDTHHQHFPEPWQCAFVFTGGGDRSEGACFRSTPEKFAGDVQLPFYEMASNESLLARGTKRSYVDWSNYTTVDEIRSEPLSRPILPAPGADAGEVPAPASTTTPPAAPAPPPRPAPPSSDRAAPPAANPAATPGAGSRRDVGVVDGGVKTGRIEFDDVGDRAAGTKKMARTDTRPPRSRDAGVAADEAPTSLDSVARELDAASAERTGPRPPRPGRKMDRKRLMWLGGGAIAAAIAIGTLFTVLGSRGTGGMPGTGAANVGDPSAPSTGEMGGPGGPIPAVSDSSVTLAELENESREMLSTISRFYGRAVERDGGRATCADLQAAFVAVEDHWIRYSTEFKGRYEGALPEDMEARDARLYAGVQDTEREFDASGCPRP